MGCEVRATKLRKIFRASKTDQPVIALDDVDLTVRSGQFYVLVGDSGSGKTTLLRSIAGLEVPDLGEMTLREEIVFSRAKDILVSPDRRRIGMVFQSYAIWPHLTVSENVSMPLIHGRQKLSREDARRRVREALETVGLLHLADRPAPRLSGGQQQRVALARAIAVSSDILLMDEPMSNLDARLREEVRAQIKSIVSRYGTTVIYVTHDQEEAMSLADELAIMRNGRILQQGTPKSLYESSATQYIAEFFGPMNQIEGMIIDRGSVETSVGVIQINSELPLGSKVTVGIRPERIQLNGPTDNGNNFSGIVTDRVYLGANHTYCIRLANLVLRVNALEEYVEGQAVKVRFPRNAIQVFPSTRFAGEITAPTDQSSAGRVS